MRSVQCLSRHHQLFFAFPFLFSLAPCAYTRQMRQSNGPGLQLCGVTSNLQGSKLPCQCDKRKWICSVHPVLPPIQCCAELMLWLLCRIVASQNGWETKSGVPVPRGNVSSYMSFWR
ncbi:hypothetical protein V8C37DRAFT_393254 [Trichoderma ceciliae]